MKFCIVQSHRLQCIFSRAFGLYRTEDIRRVNRISASIDLVRAGAPIVNDMRFVDFGVATSEVIAARNLPFTSPEADIKRQIAFVAGSTLGFGMLRVLATMRDHDGQTTEVFRTFAEAFAWIDRPAIGDALPEQIDRTLDAVLQTEEQQEDTFQVVMKHA